MLKICGMLLLATWFAGLQDPSADQILEKFRAIRPAAGELGIYRLSWTAGLKEARERATKEQRPIFLLVCTNSYGNLFTGHC
jgi:hypothetical protein